MSNDTLLLNADGTPLSVIPLSTLTWQESIKLVILDRVNVLHWHDDWEIHSQSLTMSVPSVISSRQYISRSKQGINFNRHNVFARDRHICQYCGDIFSAKDLTLDHVLPKSKGGRTTWENIVTACKPCNHNKGNNLKIVPKKMPVKPDFYQIATSKSVVINIKYEEWLTYLNWPDDKIRRVA